MNAMNFLRWQLRHLLLFLFLLLASCGGGSGSSNPSVGIETIQWQSDGSGAVKFVTNDPQYYNYNFWSTLNQASEVQMTTVAATVKKMSGSIHSGYGVIFCYQDTNNFYYLAIDSDGHYHVASRVAGAYTQLVPWSFSSRLNPGLGVQNVIGVTQTTPHNFSVSFNGTPAITFTDPNFSGGKAGFIAGINIEANENFPATPEDIRFRMNSPVAYP